MHGPPSEGICLRDFNQNTGSALEKTMKYIFIALLLAANAKLNALQASVNALWTGHGFRKHKF